MAGAPSEETNRVAHASDLGVRLLVSLFPVFIR